AQAVIDKYIAAIGGKEALGKITSMSADIAMNVSGQSLGGVMKNAAPNKSLMQLSMGGMTVMKRVFDGKKGYQEQMGQKKELGADEIAAAGDTKGLFPQLYYNTDGFKLSAPAVEKVNGEDAYKIVVTKPSGKTETEYYSAKNGLLLKQEGKIKAGGQELEQTMEFGNYTPVGGIQLPGSMTQSIMGQSVEITMKNFKLNEGVSDKDFE
ncbi:MAG TPA: hypothetical protein VL943_02540, partial [Niabella sp.]|nr:hypothetical protein [Niabella sp.]